MVRLLSILLAISLWTSAGAVALLRATIRAEGSASTLKTRGSDDGGLANAGGFAASWAQLQLYTSKVWHRCVALVEHTSWQEPADGLAVSGFMRLCVLVVIALVVAGIMWKHLWSSKANLAFMEPGSWPAMEMSLAADAPRPGPRTERTSSGASSTGSSFVVPNARIRQCIGTTLGVEIPTGGAWSLSAVLRRSSDIGPWERLELSTGSALDGQRSLLLTCCAATSTSPSFLQCRKTARSQDGGSGSDDSRCISSADNDISGPWIQICNGDGHQVACLMPFGWNRFILQRSDHTLWDIGTNLEDNDPWIVVSENGKLIGQAMSRGRGYKGGAFQVDAQPQAQSPEAALLLCAVLAAVTFSA